VVTVLSMETKSVTTETWSVVTIAKLTEDITAPKISVNHQYVLHDVEMESGSEMNNVTMEANQDVQ